MFGNYSDRPVPVPSEQPLPFYGGLNVGNTIIIYGFIPQHHGSNASVINLKPQMGQENDIYCHFSIRFHQNCIVRNTKQSGSWGREERDGGMPMSKGQAFHMIIAVHQDCFKVSINGNHFTDYRHRAAFQQISVIAFSGEFQIRSLSFGQDNYANLPKNVSNPPPYNSLYPGYQGAPAYPNYPTGHMAPPPSNPYPPPNIGFAPQNFLPGFAPVVNPPVPYKGPIYGGLYPGRVIIIGGIPNASPARFHINLMLGEDVAFHFNPRFKENCIVRNSRINGKWMNEERDGYGMPFVPRSAFQIKIIVEPDSYQVAVDGRNWCSFKHRLKDLGNIQGLEVGGDVTLSQIFIQESVNPNVGAPGGMSWPGNAVVNPPIPYRGPIYGGLYFGRVIIIQGTPKPSPTRFHVNLMLNEDVALHFNPRFKENCVVRNTKINGKWMSEERDGGMSFFPGRTFELRITVKPNCYEVAVDGQNKYTFQHRLKNLEKIQSLEVGGDLAVSQIFI